MTPSSLLRSITSAACSILATAVLGEPIYHDVKYPEGPGPHPAVVLLHTSGGFKTVRHQIPKYLNAGYVVYAPDFFRRHGITKANRFETWTTYRRAIEGDLGEIIAIMRKDARVDPRNIFAVGFSNGGYWASYLAAKRLVNAAATHYGVWAWPKQAGFDGYPASYFDTNSSPLLALVGGKDTIQRSSFVLPQISEEMKRGAKVNEVVFEDVGHSWDCMPCRADGFNANISNQALQLTVDFFQKHRRQ